MKGGGREIREKNKLLTRRLCCTRRLLIDKQTETVRFAWIVSRVTITFRLLVSSRFSFFVNFFSDPSYVYMWYIRFYVFGSIDGYIIFH